MFAYFIFKQQKFTCSENHLTSRDLSIGNARRENPSIRRVGTSASQAAEGMVSELRTGLQF